MAHVFAFGSGLVISHAHKRTALVIDNIPASHPRWTFNAAVSVCQRGWNGLDWAGIRRRGLETNQTSTRKMYLSSLVAHVRGKRVAAEWRGGGGAGPVCQSAYLSGATKCKASKNLGQIAVTVFIFRRYRSFVSFPLSLHLASSNFCLCYGRLYAVGVDISTLTGHFPLFRSVTR